MTDLTGTNTPDLLIGTAGHDFLASFVLTLPNWGDYDDSPLSDADTLHGHAGNDTLAGGNGADLLYGGGGDDWFAEPAGGDLAYGGSGADLFDNPSSTYFATTVIYGGAGVDTLHILDWVGSAISYLSVADPDQWQTLSDGTRLVGIERLDVRVTHGTCTLIGGIYDDTLESISEGDDDLFGGGGNDRLADWGDGNDRLFGGDGDDVLHIGAGVCIVFGGNGDDEVYDSWDLPSAPGSILDGGTGFDRISLYNFGALVGFSFNFQVGGTQVMPGDRILTGFEQLSIFGSRFDDTLTAGRFDDNLGGDEGDDVLRGAGGDDVLSGELGDDTLIGGSGSDRLDGWAGSNHLFGGKGCDRLILSGADDRATGGRGADAFQFSADPTLGGHARISDFSGQDRIILDTHAFATLSFLHLSPGAFVRGTAAQDATDRILYDIATGALRYDPDGNGSLAAHLFAHLAPDTALTSTDFLIL